MGRFRDAFDEAAFDTVMHRYHRAAFAFACSFLHNATAAEDAVQEAFVRIVRQRRKYDPARPFKPWFFQLLRNVCLDAQRKHQRHARKLREFAESAITPNVPQRAARLLDVLHVLTPEDKELLTLRMVQGLSFAELATHFGCTEEAAKKRGQRALAKLRATEIASPHPKSAVRRDPVRPLPRTRRADRLVCPPSSLPDFAG